MLVGAFEPTESFGEGPCGEGIAKGRLENLSTSVTFPDAFGAHSLSSCYPYATLLFRHEPPSLGERGCCKSAMYASGTGRYYFPRSKPVTSGREWPSLGGGAVSVG
jgi:hypothetical protein